MAGAERGRWEHSPRNSRRPDHAAVVRSLHFIRRPWGDPGVSAGSVISWSTLGCEEWLVSKGTFVIEKANE